MYWAPSLLLMLVVYACFVPGVSLGGVLGADKVEHNHFKHGTRDRSSTLDSLRSNARESSKVLVVQSSLTKSEQSETIRSRMSDEEPRKEQSETIKSRMSEKEPMKTQFTESDDRLSTIINVDHNPGTVKPKTQKNGHSVEILTSPGSEYRSEAHNEILTSPGSEYRSEAHNEILTSPGSEYRSEAHNEILTSPGSKYRSEAHNEIGGDQNAAQSEESSQWFGKEKELDNTSTKDSELTLDIYTHHKDKFYCPPCNCSYGNTRFVIANCTHTGLISFPLNLPNKTLALILSFNPLRALVTSSFLRYRYLENVTLASNTKMTEIINTSIGNQRSNVKVLNITSCSIRTIQDASFDVTPELTHLIISHNILTNISKSTFKGLGKLLHLDLSANMIAFLEVGTFDDLNELLSLDLSKNKKLGYTGKRFPPLLFQNLKRLQKLSIHSNTDHKAKSYPSRTLHDLVELRKLSIDGLVDTAEFGPEMKALEKLTSLEIRGRCQIVNITETFFQYFPHLTSFTMDLCQNFAHVHPKAYTKLRRLQTLSISRMNDYYLDIAFQDLTGLYNSPLRWLTLRHLRRPNYQCRYLGHEFSRYLQNFTLVYLDLSENAISLIGTDFLREFPKSIKTLILKRNKFTCETQSLNQMSVLTGVTEIDLSMQNVDHIFQKGYSSLGDGLGLSDPDDEISHRNRGIHFSPESDQRTELAHIGSDVLEEQSDLTIADHDQPKKMFQSKKHFKIPPNMHTLKASYYNVFGMQILTHHLRGKNSLSVIDFSNSFMPTWGTGSLPPGITFANLGYNYCSHINTDFFKTNNSHLHLLLNNNFLGSDFANDTTGNIFSKLSKTEYLDISTNLIYTIPKQFFSGLSSLRYLHMSDNKLSTLNASFAHMKTLQFIDFSRNSISWIDAETRDDLDVIAASPGHVLKIDLTMNRLPCTCDGLELISWMATTKVHFHKEHKLTCYPDNKVEEPLGDLEKRRQRLQRSCVSKSLFIIGGSAALTVVMVIVMLGFMYRYRWKLRYLHNTTMAAVFGFKPEVSQKSGCTFDAYFVYTTDTRDFVLDQCLKELEVTRGHRLCVEDRDFWVGTYIVSSIVSAVRNSTKTVVVLTPDLLEEPYCEYSFKMAVMEELYKQRTVLHLLLYQPVDSDQMSHDELSLMKRNSYIEYPPDGGADEGVRRKFWDELSQVIGHSGSDKTDPVLDME